MKNFLLLVTVLTVHSAAPLFSAETPVVRVTLDDAEVTQSCVIEIAEGTVLADSNSDGVIHIKADNLVVRFMPGSILQGAAASTPWDRLTGIGIRIDGHTNVTIEGAQVHGFKNGLVASHADGLTVSGGDFSDNYRQHLKSTPAAEDGSDWMFPHNNDQEKWRDAYGGAVCVEDSSSVTIRDILVRRGQNGIIIDHVNDSAIYDNDCSFLSGWGLAMWQSSRNMISRNAFDFCVRGHVEGVYNRGQDSAGILCFEQCNDNVFAENSVTHGGDGFFGFGGKEAIGERWMDRERERLRKETGKQDVDDLIKVPAELARQMSALGCNRNLLIGNDLSYAPAHGIEMTFSEGNMFVRNRIVENAICGVWGGYSAGTLIAENEFTGNGGMAYGLERGAINMEHAANNLIVSNRFVNNKCGVHLWWNDNAGLLKLPGVAGGEQRVTGNVIAGNTFEINSAAPFSQLGQNEKLIVLQLRDPSQGKNVFSNAWFANHVELTHPQAVEFAVEQGCDPVTNGTMPTYQIPAVKILGTKKPVGARVALRGRDQILMDEWGPWDHASPLVRAANAGANQRAYEVFGVTALKPPVVLEGNVSAEVGTAPSSGAQQVTLTAPAGVSSYRIALAGDGFARELTGTIVATEWQATFFPWKIDPREDLAGWRKLAEGSDAVRVAVAGLDFPYGWGGPKDQKLGETVSKSSLGADHFGMIARTTLNLPEGRWRFKTQSDDGIRIVVAGTPVIENWTWHGPTPNEGLFQQPTDGEVEILVEHFEIDGFSTLKLDIEAAGD
jgi:parallel beta-helix repeat protein